MPLTSHTQRTAATLTLIFSLLLGLLPAANLTAGAHAPAAAGVAATPSGTAADPAARAGVEEAYGRLPLQFEPNVGQTDEQVKFISRGGGGTLFLTAAEAVFVLGGGAAEGRDKAGAPARSDGRASARAAGRDRESASADEATEGRPENGAAAPEEGAADVVRMRLVGANLAPEVAGSDELPGKVNYLKGDDPAA